MATDMPPRIYRSASILYRLLWSLAIPLLSRNKRLREGLRERTLRCKLPRADLWIQAASVGESYLALELLNNLAPPESLSVLLTTNTSQGRDILDKAKEEINSSDRNITVHTAYFPFDSPVLMDKAVSAVHPRVVLLLESELWPGLLMACREKGIQVMVVNGRMTARSLKRYQLIPAFWKTYRPGIILAMSEDDASRFAELFGNDIVEIMSNIKFDRINAAGPLPSGENPLTSILPSAMPDDREETQFVVLGSVRQEEENEIENLIADLRFAKPDAIIGLFPRHMHRIESWRKKLDRMAVNWSLRSRMTGPADKGQIILWDCMGELYQAYSLARAAFVGGSLAPLGGQNFLEPLTCGIKPVIGPHWSNFYWIGRGIVDQGLVHEAQDRRECAAYLIEELSQPLDRENNRRLCLEYISSRKGGTTKAIDNIAPLLFNTPRPPGL